MDKKQRVRGSTNILRSVTVDLPKIFARRDPNFRYKESRKPRRILTKPGRPARNDGYDNDDNDYIIRVYDVLDDKDDQQVQCIRLPSIAVHSSCAFFARYRVIDLLGRGTFGQVVKCERLSTGELVSVKIIKNKPEYREHSNTEVDVLNQVSI